MRRIYDDFVPLPIYVTCTANFTKYNPLAIKFLLCQYENTNETVQFFIKPAVLNDPFFASLQNGHSGAVEGAKPPQPPKTATTHGIMIMTRTKIEKPQKKIRQKSIKVRFNDKEYEQMLKRQSGNTLAGWLRQVALGIVPIHQADTDLVRNIGRIGSNLNQIAKYVNTEKLIDQNVLNEITAIRAMMHKLIEQNISNAIAKDNANDC